MSQWHARCSNAATPWMNTFDSCWNETRWCILVHNEKLWTIVLGIGTKQQEIPFLATTSTYILNRAWIFITFFNISSFTSVIFKDFGMQITNTTVFAKIFIFQKWALFPIWQSTRAGHGRCHLHDCVLNRRFIDQQWSNGEPRRSYIFYLQLLDIELITNFVYQTNNNHWATAWLLTWHNNNLNNLKQF